MAATKQSAADRLRRGSPIVQPSSPVPSSSSKKTRVSLDLDEARYRRLRQFAFERDTTHAEVLRQLVDLLDDPTMADRIAV